jgi:hypothetical protein
MRCIGYAAFTPADRLAGPGVVTRPTMAQVRDVLVGELQADQHW